MKASLFRESMKCNSACLSPLDKPNQHLSFQNGAWGTSCSFVGSPLPHSQGRNVTSIHPVTILLKITWISPLLGENILWSCLRMLLHAPVMPKCKLPFHSQEGIREERGRKKIYLFLKLTPEQTHCDLNATGNLTLTSTTIPKLPTQPRPQV